MNYNNSWNGRNSRGHGGSRGRFNNHNRGRGASRGTSRGSPRGSPRGPSRGGWQQRPFQPWTNSPNVNRFNPNQQIRAPFRLQRERQFRSPPRAVQRCLSPLPGSEEYTQRNIQQASELIKRQLNIDSDDSDLINSNYINFKRTDNLDRNADHFVSANTNPENLDRTADHFISVNMNPENPRVNLNNEETPRKIIKSKTKPKPIIDVQEIHDKIIKHISKLSHSKKMNVVNQGSAGYDLAIHQLQKQQRIELSRALREMCNRPTQDSADCEVINSIIPDIGIKIEDLPREVIAQLSSTLNVDFESNLNQQIPFNLVDPEACFKQAQDLLLHDPINVSFISNQMETSQQRMENEPEQFVHTNIEINNPFDFEYLNKPLEANRPSQENSASEQMSIAILPQIIDNSIPVISSDTIPIIKPVQSRSPPNSEKSIKFKNESGRFKGEGVPFSDTEEEDATFFQINFHSTYLPPSTIAAKSPEPEISDKGSHSKIKIRTDLSSIEDPIIINKLISYPSEVGIQTELTDSQKETSVTQKIRLNRSRKPKCGGIDPVALQHALQKQQEKDEAKNVVPTKEPEAVQNSILSPVSVHDDIKIEIPEDSMQIPEMQPLFSPEIIDTDYANIIMKNKTPPEPSDGCMNQEHQLEYGYGNLEIKTGYDRRNEHRKQSRERHFNRTSSNHSRRSSEGRMSDENRDAKSFESSRKSDNRSCENTGKDNRHDNTRVSTERYDNTRVSTERYDSTRVSTERYDNTRVSTERYDKFDKRYDADKSKNSRSDKRIDERHVADYKKPTFTRDKQNPENSRFDRHNFDNNSSERQNLSDTVGNSTDKNVSDNKKSNDDVRHFSDEKLRDSTKTDSRFNNPRSEENRKVRDQSNSRFEHNRGTNQNKRDERNKKSEQDTIQIGTTYALKETKPKVDAVRDPSIPFKIPKLNKKDGSDKTIASVPVIKIAVESVEKTEITEKTTKENADIKIDKVVEKPSQDSNILTKIKKNESSKIIKNEKIKETAKKHITKKNEELKNNNRTSIEKEKRTDKSKKTTTDKVDTETNKTTNEKVVAKLDNEKEDKKQAENKEQKKLITPPLKANPPENRHWKSPGEKKQLPLHLTTPIPYQPLEDELLDYEVSSNTSSGQNTQSHILESDASDLNETVDAESAPHPLLEHMEEFNKLMQNVAKEDTMKRDEIEKRHRRTSRSQDRIDSDEFKEPLRRRSRSEEKSFTFSHSLSQMQEKEKSKKSPQIGHNLILDSENTEENSKLEGSTSKKRADSKVESKKEYDKKDKISSVKINIKNLDEKKPNNNTPELSTENPEIVSTKKLIDKPTDKNVAEKLTGEHTLVVKMVSSGESEKSGKIVQSKSKEFTKDEILGEKLFKHKGKKSKSRKPSLVTTDEKVEEEIVENVKLNDDNILLKNMANEDTANILRKLPRLTVHLINIDKIVGWEKKKDRSCQDLISAIENKILSNDGLISKHIIKTDKQNLTNDVVEETSKSKNHNKARPKSRQKKSEVCINEISLTPTLEDADVSDSSIIEEENTRSKTWNLERPKSKQIKPLELEIHINATPPSPNSKDLDVRNSSVALEENIKSDTPTISRQRKASLLEVDINEAPQSLISEEMHATDSSVTLEENINSESRHVARSKCRQINPSVLEARINETSRSPVSEDIDVSDCSNTLGENSGSKRRKTASAKSRQRKSSVLEVDLNINETPQVPIKDNVLVSDSSLTLEEDTKSNKRKGARAKSRSRRQSVLEVDININEAPQVPISENLLVSDSSSTLEEHTKSNQRKGARAKSRQRRYSLLKIDINEAPQSPISEDVRVSDSSENTKSNKRKMARAKSRERRSSVLEIGINEAQKSPNSEDVRVSDSSVPMEENTKSNKSARAKSRQRSRSVLEIGINEAQKSPNSEDVRVNDTSVPMEENTKSNKSARAKSRQRSRSVLEIDIHEAPRSPVSEDVRVSDSSVALEENTKSNKRKVAREKSRQRRPSVLEMAINETPQSPISEDVRVSDSSVAMEENTKSYRKSRAKSRQRTFRDIKETARASTSKDVHVSDSSSILEENTRSKRRKTVRSRQREPNLHQVHCNETPLAPISEDGHVSDSSTTMEENAIFKNRNSKERKSSIDGVQIHETSASISDDKFLNDFATETSSRRTNTPIIISKEIAHITATSLKRKGRLVGPQIAKKMKIAGHKNIDEEVQTEPVIIVKCLERHPDRTCLKIHRRNVLKNIRDIDKEIERLSNLRTSLYDELYPQSDEELIHQDNSVATILPNIKESIDTFKNVPTTHSMKRKRLKLIHEQAATTNISEPLKHRKNVSPIIILHAVTLNKKLDTDIESDKESDVSISIPRKVVKRNKNPIYTPCTATVDETIDAVIRGFSENSLDIADPDFSEAEKSDAEQESKLKAIPPSRIINISENTNYDSHPLGKTLRINLIRYELKHFEAMRERLRTSNVNTTVSNNSGVNESEDRLEITIETSEATPIDKVEVTNIQEPTSTDIAVPIDWHGQADVIFNDWTGSILVIKVIESTVLAGNDKGIFYFYDLTTGEQQHSITLCQRPITSISIIKNEDKTKILLYIGCLDGNLYLIDYDSKELIKTINVEDPIQCMESSWGYIFLGSHKGNLIRYAIKKEETEDSVSISNSNVLVLRATQDGSRRVLLVATRNSPVTVRDAMNGLLMRTMEGTLNPTVYTLLFHKSHVYCGTSQHDVLVYTFQDGQLMFKHEQSNTSGVVCMNIVKNLLFVGCYNGNIYIYNTNTNAFIGSMAGPGGLFLSMEVSGNKVVAGTKQNHFKSWTLPQNILDHMS